LIEWYLTLLLLGVAVGLLAGLFGIGGGTLMVPILTMLFLGHGVESSHAIHLALGSTMASIIATACASAWAHHRLGSICWRQVRQLTPGVVIGTAVVALWLPHWNARGLAIAFAIYIALIAIQMIRKQPSIHPHHPLGNLTMAVIGSAIGGISALVSIGGGSMVVPLLSWSGMIMQRAIGTSAAIGVAISVVGTLCYSFANISPTGTPTIDGATGIIYLPAVLLISVASIATAPIGARWSQRLPEQQLRRSYALLLLLLCIAMLWALFG